MHLYGQHKFYLTHVHINKACFVLRKAYFISFPKDNNNSAKLLDTNSENRNCIANHAMTHYKTKEKESNSFSVD